MERSHPDVQPILQPASGCVTYHISHFSFSSAIDKGYHLGAVSNFPFFLCMIVGNVAALAPAVPKRFYLTPISSILIYGWNQGNHRSKVK